MLSWWWRVIVSVINWQPSLRAVTAGTGALKKNQAWAPLPDRDVTVLQVVQYGLVGDRGEGLARTLSALHIREPADTWYELVRTQRSVAGLARLLAHETRG